MLTGWQFHMLRDLFDDGLSIIEIARQTGHDRKTISKYIDSETPPLRKKRTENPVKLDPYKDYIIGRLNEHPLSALRLYREILDQGFKENMESSRTLFERLSLRSMFLPSIDMRLSQAFKHRSIGQNAAKSEFAEEQW
jgi:transposase